MLPTRVVQVEYRVEAVRCLAEMDKDDKAVLPLLVQLFKTEHRCVCQAAAAALKELDPKAAAAAGIP
jgi:hypothetical protein